MSVRFSSLFVVFLILSFPVICAQQGQPDPYYDPSGAEGFNPSNVIYKFVSYLIFGSVNMRSQAKDYVDVWYAKSSSGENVNDYFLSAYVESYRAAKSSVESWSPEDQPPDTSIVHEVEAAASTNTFLGRLTLFLKNGPDGAKARVLVNVLLSLLLVFGLCFVICLPLPPGMMSLKSSGIEAFIVAIIATFFLTWFGVTSKFLSLVVIVVMCLLMAILYSVVFARHSIGNMYGDEDIERYRYPPPPRESGWWD